MSLPQVYSMILPWPSLCIQDPHAVQSDIPAKRTKGGTKQITTCPLFAITIILCSPNTHIKSLPHLNDAWHPFAHSVLKSIRLYFWSNKKENENQKRRKRRNILLLPSSSFISHHHHYLTLSWWYHHCLMNHPYIMTTSQPPHHLVYHVYLLIDILFWFIYFFWSAV